MRHAQAHAPTSRWAPAITLAVITAGLMLAGCGASSRSTSPGGGPTQAQLQQARQDAVRFAGCMRSHGVPNLPDPTTSPRAFKESLSGSNAQSPAVQSAETACRHLLPRGGPPNQSPRRGQAQIAALLAFARCIRTHGFPTFPDPASSGQLTHQMLAAAGITLHQPALLQAADACVSVTHGAITKATVARFAAGQ
jgi:hypothetical protein